MATTTFKASGALAVGVGTTTVYTAPALTTALVMGLVLSNILTSDINVTITWTDASAAATYNLGKTIPIPAGGSVVVVGDNNRKILEAGDALKVVSDTADSVDVSVDVMELA